MTPLQHIALIRAALPMQKQDLIDTFAKEHKDERWLEQQWMSFMDAVGGPDEKRALDKLQAEYTRLTFSESPTN